MLFEPVAADVLEELFFTFAVAASVLFLEPSSFLADEEEFLEAVPLAVLSLFVFEPLEVLSASLTDELSETVAGALLSLVSDAGAPQEAINTAAAQAAEKIIIFLFKFI